MPKAKDSYRVSGRTPEELQREINFMLARMADRMDKIEGIRGTASIESDLEMNSHKIKELESGSASNDAATVAATTLPEPLQAIARVTFAANQIPVFASAALVSAVPLTSAGQAITTVETPAEQRTAMDVPARSGTESISGAWTYSQVIAANGGIQVTDSNGTVIHSIGI